MIEHSTKFFRVDIFFRNHFESIPLQFYRDVGSTDNEISVVILHVRNSGFYCLRRYHRSIAPLRYKDLFIMHFYPVTSVLQNIHSLS